MDWVLTDHIEEIDELTNAQIRRIAQRAFNVIKKRTPVRTGTLRRGWELIHQRVGGVIQSIARNEVEYVGFVEYGTSKMEGAHMVESVLWELDNGSYRSHL